MSIQVAKKTSSVLNTSYFIYICQERFREEGFFKLTAFLLVQLPATDLMSKHFADMLMTDVLKIDK